METTGTRAETKTTAGGGGGRRGGGETTEHTCARLRAVFGQLGRVAEDKRSQLLQEKDVLDAIFDDDDEDTSVRHVNRTVFPWLPLMPEWQNLHLSPPRTAASATTPINPQAELANLDLLHGKALSLTSPSTMRVASRRTRFSRFSALGSPDLAEAASPAAQNHADTTAHSGVQARAGDRWNSNGAIIRTSSSSSGGGGGGVGVGPAGLATATSSSSSSATPHSSPLVTKNATVRRVKAVVTRARAALDSLLADGMPPHAEADTTTTTTTTATATTTTTTTTVLSRHQTPSSDVMQTAAAPALEACK